MVLKWEVVLFFRYQNLPHNNPRLLVFAVVCGVLVVEFFFRFVLRGGSTWGTTRCTTQSVVLSGITFLGALFLLGFYFVELWYLENP